MSNAGSVYLNGQFVAAEQATVSVFDRGFIFGDAVYEVIPVYGRKPFRLAQHLKRLDTNLQAVAIQNPVSDEQWQDILQRIITGVESEEQSLYIQITRGVAPRDHAFPPDQIEPTVLAFGQPLKPVAQELLDNGTEAITTDDIRWQRCDIKSTALLANVLLRQAAVEQNAAEAILMRDGFITEGAASNVIIVDEGGTIATPPKSHLILPGVTRDLVLQLAQQHNLPMAERPLQASEINSAREIWLSSSTKEILPVTRVDGKAIGDGKPGPVFQAMYRHYQDYKQAFREGHAD